MALTDCLSDWIGLRGVCTDESPGSGLYINDLPRINISFMENLSDYEQAGFKEIWEKVERRGLQTFGGNVKQLLRSNLEFRSIASSVSTGEWNNDGTAISPTNGRWYGYKIKPVRNKYMALYLNYITFYSDSALSIPIRVYNLDTGEQLYVNNFSASIGLNTFNVNQEFSLSEGRTLWIGFLSTVYDSIRVERGNYPNMGQKYLTQEWNGFAAGETVFIENNLIGSDIDPTGAILNFNLVCSMDEFICQNRSALSLGLWYWMGYEFMQEWLGNFGNDQINVDTLVDDDLKRNWRDWYKSMAEKEISQVMRSVKPDYDGVCFECKPVVRAKYYLP